MESKVLRELGVDERHVDAVHPLFGAGELIVELHKVVVMPLLDAVSPLATLQRGYAIVTDSKGTVITDAQDVRAGQLIDARLTKGTIRARIERTTNPELDLRMPKEDEK